MNRHGANIARADLKTAKAIADWARQKPEVKPTPKRQEGESMESIQTPYIEEAA